MWKTSHDVFSFYAEFGGKSVNPEIVTMPIGENQDLPLTLGFTGNGEGGKTSNCLRCSKLNGRQCFFGLLTAGAGNDRVNTRIRFEHNVLGFWRRHFR